MRQLKQFGFAIWYTFVACYCAVMFLNTFGMLRAQQLPPPTLPEVERRLAVIEATNFDHRMTVIEGKQDTLQKTVDQILDKATWEKLTSGGTALLILERLAVATLLKKRKEGGAREN